APLHRPALGVRERVEHVPTRTDEGARVGRLDARRDRECSFALVEQWRGLATRYEISFSSSGIRAASSVVA
ncbi:MAG: hypothetical protein L0G59_13030, partial [Kocuria sp.]|nr:hypothetical protein [Kocuria sp.]